MSVKWLYFAAIQVVFLIWCAPLLAESCGAATCHKKLIVQKMPHQPVKEMECLSCHKQVKPHPPGKSFEFVATGSKLCYECHSPFNKGKIAHEPVKNGECIACHKVHGAEGRYLLDVSADQTPLCTKCHDSAMFNQKFMHGPVAVGECTKCHDPHMAKEKSLLNGAVRDVCLGCHVDFAKSLKEAAFAHKPVKDDPCTSCHDPHGSSVNSILKKKMPDLCIGCHTSISKKVAGVKVPHKPILQEGGCGKCHAAHFSKGKGLLMSDEMSVCLGCHDKNDLGNPRLRNIKKDLAGKKYLHGPINKGECKACHDPHGSDNFRMLRGSYPAALYAPYKEGIYGACLSCHNKKLLTFAETTLNTSFRNGNRNLHYVHVSNNRKGRTCRICHAPHASNGVKLIDTDGAKFGEWDIPINFQITPTGGSCAPGCHRAFKYDREKPVAY